MKKLNILLVSLFALATTACSSLPQDTSTYVKVGKVQSVKLEAVEKKPSMLKVLTGAAVGGVVGHQFGGGSAKDWTTAGGAIIGGVVTDQALTKRYNQISYKIYVPETKEYMILISGVLENNVFKNDLVVVYKTGRKIRFDAYGQYSKDKHALVNRKLLDGTL